MSNIPKGYKQTEVGVIPGDWEVKKLGEISDFSQGVQVDLLKQIKEEKLNYERFLRIENYTQNSDDYRFIPIEYGRNKIIDKDDIVVIAQ
jgi:type I restriction enzyme S subunit